MSHSGSVPPWYLQGWLRTTTLVVLLAIAGVQGYLAIFVRENDILVHREAGGAFLAGDPYGLGQDTYPVGRIMMNAALAVAPVYPTRAVCYALAVLALLVCYQRWRRLANQEDSVTPSASFASMTATLVMLFPYVIRDLDDCGLHIYLLFFLTAAGYALAARRPGWSGFWLATAATYKVTPLLFLPYLLWKRQWQAAGWMVVFLAGWGLAPALFVGLDKTLECQARWASRVASIGSVREAYPSQGEIEGPRPHNLSLQACIARYLQTYPPGHPLVMEHPAFLQFGDLEPLAAFYAVRAALLALGLVLAWRFRHVWAHQQGRPQLAAEWAAVCLLCALLSPVCWKQHLVVALPAVFLGWRAVLAGGPWARLRWSILVVAATIVLLSRHFVVGREFSIVLLTYKVDTVAMLLTLGVILTLPRRPATVAGPALAAPVIAGARAA